MTSIKRHLDGLFTGTGLMCSLLGMSIKYSGGGSFVYTLKKKPESIFYL